MDILVDSRQMKQCDKNTIEYFGVPSLVLMERAALGVVEEIEEFIQCIGGVGHQQREGYDKGQQVLVVCGFGNNGGDGLVVGRLLWQKGFSVTIVMPPEGRMSKETKMQREILGKYGIPIVSQIPDQKYDVVVDALFGIGLARDLEGIHRELIVKMNEMPGYKVAVDIPSGLHADTGAVMGVAFQADLTITFAYAKIGLLLFPGAEYAGRIAVKDIGIDGHSFLGEQPACFHLTQKDLKKVPSRKAYSNKGSYGKVLVAAGQKNMAGAAFFTGKAAYHTGAGMVKVMTEEENRIILQQLLPEAILETWTETEITKKLKDSFAWASVIAAGPGIGTDESAECAIQCILEQSGLPVILDADGLNIAAKHLDWLKKAKTSIIITPHLGEMARLVKMDIKMVQEQFLQVAKNFSKEYNVICVLKDAHTVTALPDGRIWMNTSGNHGMATAGSGDVLTGILAGLVAQGMEPQEAAPMGVFLHGLAGDIQAAQKGAYGLTAQDILEGIPKVLRDVG